MNDVIVDINGKNILVKARVSNKARRIGLRENIKGDVELVMPIGASYDVARKFVINNLEWIRARLNNSKDDYEKLEEIPNYISNETRWGSCSGERSLRFNWRLVFVDEEIIESVVAHELAHTKIMNHSTAFWELVYTLCPQTLVADIWLKEKGRAIHSILKKYK